jgi:hypothetical protein
MVNRITLSAAALLSCLSIPAVAADARPPEGIVSGPASGSNVIPSTAIQKRMFEGRSVGVASPQQRANEMGALIAAGAPGLEGAPDTQSGRQ